MIATSFSSLCISCHTYLHKALHALTRCHDNRGKHTCQQPGIEMLCQPTPHACTCMHTHSQSHSSGSKRVAYLRQAICGSLLLQFLARAVTEKADGKYGGNPQQGCQHSLVETPDPFVPDCLRETVQSACKHRGFPWLGDRLGL